MPLPAVASPELRFDKTFVKHADGSRPRVLYAEDSTASRVVTTAMLKRMGLDVDLHQYLPQQIGHLVNVG